MKELIEKIIRYLPQYFIDFGSLFVGPKRFIRQRNTAAEDTFLESLIFLGISFVLEVIATASLLPPNKDLWTNVGSNAVLYLLILSLTALALRLAWRIVGGKATIRSYFVTYAYFLGVMIIIMQLFMLFSQGVSKVFEPELYFNNQTIPDASGSSIPLFAFGIVEIGYIFYSVWAFVAWGAYRELNGLSKWRSFFALMIMLVLGAPITAIGFFVAAAIG